MGPRKRAACGSESGCLEGRRTGWDAAARRMGIPRPSRINRSPQLGGGFSPLRARTRLGQDRAPRDAAPQPPAELALVDVPTFRFCFWCGGGSLGGGSVLLAWPMRGKIGADDSFASGATLTGKAGSFASALGCSNITPCPRVQLNASSSPVKSQQPFWRGLLSGRRFKLSTKNCAPSTGDPISRDGTKTSSFWIYVLVGTVIFTALIVGDSRDPRY